MELSEGLVCRGVGLDVKREREDTDYVKGEANNPAEQLLVGEGVVLGQEVEVRAGLVGLVVSVHFDEEPVEMLLEIRASACQVDIIINLLLCLILEEE